MKNKFMRGAALGLAMVTAFTFTAPNSALLNAEAAAKKQATAATKITAKAASVKVGKTAKVTVKINKKATKNVTINVKAKNAKVAKVAKTLTIKKGKKAATLKVKGLKKGSTNVTLSFKNSKGKNVKKTIKVTVKKAAVKTVAATGVTFGKASYSVGVGQTTTLDYAVVPENTTETATWTSSDESVATVANGVVTGVKEGKATITVAFNENVVATTEVNVSKDAIIYNLTGVKQLSANTIELTFDNEYAINLTKNDDITVTNVVDDTKKEVVFKASKLTWNTDGKVAVATLDGTLSDKVEYKVALKEGTPINFTASVGDVASINIKTATVQANVPTKVEYSLNDANGIDVTSTVTNLNTISITQEGATVSKSDIDNYQIVMETVGSKATITITYEKDNKSEPIVAKADINCVDTQAVVGEGVFKSIKAEDANDSNINAKSECAKFYLSGMSDSEVVVEDAVPEEYVYFYAKDANGKAINYDSYDIESSDSGKVTGSIEDNADGGKFVRIKVEGTLSSGTQATAQLNIAATKYNKTTYYRIPVKVVKKAVIDKVVITLDKPEISNAYDEEYTGELKAEVFDNRGNKMKASDLSSVVIKFKSDKQKLDIADGISATSAAATGIGNKGFMYSVKTNTAAEFSGAAEDAVATVDNEQTMTAKGTSAEYKAYYEGWGAVAGSYTMLVIAKDNEGKSVEKQATVQVKGLPKAAWDGTGTTVTYKVYMDDESVDEAKLGDSKTVARLGAYASSGIFAGYVRQQGITSDNTATIGAESGGGLGFADGNIKLTANASRIYNIRQYAYRSGNARKTKSAGVAQLWGLNAKNNTIWTDRAAGVGSVNTDKTAAMKIETVNDAAAHKYVCPSRSTLDEVYAQTGKWRIEFKYDQKANNKESKDQVKYFDLDVKNTLVAPTVSKNIESNLVEGLDSNSIKDVLEASVDLNNDDANDSIGDLYGKVVDNKPVLSESSNNKYSVLYVAVQETNDGRIFDVLVPIEGYNSGAEFRAK